jgi:hypothetical protein
MKLTTYAPTPRPVLRCSCCGAQKTIITWRIKTQATRKTGADSVCDASVLQGFGM